MCDGVEWRCSSVTSAPLLRPCAAPKHRVCRCGRKQKRSGAVYVQTTTHLLNVDADLPASVTALVLEPRRKKQELCLRVSKPNKVVNKCPDVFLISLTLIHRSQQLACLKHAVFLFCGSVLIVSSSFCELLFCPNMWRGLCSVDKRVGTSYND